MSSQRKTALVAGVFFVVTFVTSIPALLLYGPLLDHADYILGPGADTRISVGALLEVLLAIANIGTAVTLFPVLKRQNEAVSLGYVATRVVESTIIVAGIVSVLTVVTLRQDFAGTGADAASLTLAGKSLVAFHDWTFLFGPAFCAGFGNGLLLGYLMYRSGLVPRRMALLGPRRRPAVLRVRNRCAVRGLRADRRIGVPRHAPRDRLGGVARHLADRQGVQAFDPRGSNGGAACDQSRLTRLAFGVAVEPVVGDRLPLARVVDEGAPLRPDAVSGIEEAEAHAPDLTGLGIRAPERAAADGAEALRPAVLWRVGPHELLAGEEVEGAGSEPRLWRGCGAGPALAPRAVAVAGPERLLRHLEAHAATHAVPAVGRTGHDPTLPSPPR